SSCDQFGLSFFTCRSTTGTYTLSLHDALPILGAGELVTDLVDVPVWRRNELTSPWRGQAYSGVALSPRYAHADSNPPLVSVFWRDRKSTRLNSSHVKSSYAVFCLKKKKHSSTL